MKQTPKFTSVRGSKHAMALACLMVLPACGDSGSTGMVRTTASSTSNTTTTTEAPSLLVTSVRSVNAVINSGVVSTAVAFNSSESTPLTNLKVTGGLSSLPAGWSGAASFSCASVTTGSGCVLNLTYAPTAVEKGTLTIAFSFTDGAGTAQTGSTTIDYAGTTNNNVVGTVAPSGQVVAIVGSGSQTVTVTFDTDDGNVATAFALTTVLTSLPAGWSSAANTVTCASVSTGNACQLTLSFTPTAISSGTLSLAYSYTDNFGTAKTGVVNIPYAGTVHDNVVGTAVPSPVYGVVGNAAIAVPVTFTTDDGNVATHLALTSSLGTLPAGWSSTATTFTCSSVSTGSACELPLSFTAAIGDSGTLQLQYSYTDNAGTAKTGSVNIAYTSATHDNIVGTPSTTGTIRLAVGDSQTIDVTFNTDDGNTASDLAVTSGLTSLPAAWSGPATFSCASIGTGAGCQIALTFAPTTTVSGTVTLGYSYTDSAGTAKTGTVSLPYAVRHVYVEDYNGVYLCSIVTGGSLSGCTLTASNRQDSTGSATTNAYGITFANDFAYINQYPDPSASVCAVNLTDGTLTGCSTFNFPAPHAYGYAIFAANSYLYLGNDPSLYCPIGANGAVGMCSADTNNVAGEAAGIFVGSQKAYVTKFSSQVLLCSVAANGDLTPCNNTGAPGGGGGVTISGNFLFLTSTNLIESCPINADGTLGTCLSSTVAGADQGPGVGTAVYGTHAYTVTASDVKHCAVNTSTGAVTSCAISDGGATFTAPSGLAIY